MDEPTLLKYRLHDNISKMLLEKYNILSVIDVLNSTHIEYVDLPRKLSQYKNYTFKDRDRIIILLDDIDFYPSLVDGVGIFVSNLMFCLKENNIPEYFVYLLTNHHGIEKQVEFLNKIIGYNLINVITSDIIWKPTYPMEETVDKIINRNLTSDNEYLYSCVNYRDRRHRSYTVCKFAEQDLLKNGIVSLRRVPF